MIVIRTALGALGVFCMLGVTGCSFVSAAREMAGAALEDRAHADLMRDTEIDSKLVRLINQRYSGTTLDLSFDVWEQRVLVTGTVDTPTLREEISRLVGTVPDVRATYYEVQPVSTEDKEQRLREKEQGDQKKNTGGAGEIIDDLWIAKKVEGQLLSGPGVRSINYRWRVVRRTLYIIGRARSQTELDEVLRICRETKGVKEVKHFVEIKPV